MASVQSTGDRSGARWVSLERAAGHLGMTAAALRKSLERRAVRAADGATEAALDGVRARKFGRSWRVRFSEAWGNPVSLRGALHEAREGA